MTTVATYEGVVRQGRIQLTQAAVLPEGSQVYVVVANQREQADLLDPYLAQRKANGWLVSYVGSVMAQQPQLQQVAGRLSWRFKAFLTARDQPPRGPVGFVDVDAYTGDVLNDENTATQMIANAAAVARSLSSTES